MTLPAHKPTATTRSKVSSLKTSGATNEDIAKYLDICADTLVKYYKEELHNALVDANECMSGSLYKNGMSGDTGAQIFWLKTRGRWRTEDSVKLAESNDDLTREIKELREKLDAQNKKEY